MTEPKHLYRDVEKGVLGGVLAGLAEYLGADIAIVRVVWILLTIFTAFFPGAIAYLVMWLVVPKKPAATTPPPVAQPPA